MFLNNCKKASIYSLEHIYFCDAAVSHMEEDSALLTMEDSAADFLTSEVYVTFFDGARGLITYFCELSDYKEFMILPGVWKSSAHCVVKQEMSVLQRRDDVKIPTHIPVTLHYTDEKNTPAELSAVLRNISAGGVFFTCCHMFDKNSFVTFDFSPKQHASPLRLEAQILRMQDRETLHEMIGHEADNQELNGYGCKFFELSAHYEAQIRNFVFQRDLVIKKGTLLSQLSQESES